MRRWGTLYLALLLGCGQNYEEGAHPAPKPLPRSASSLPAGHPPVEDTQYEFADEPGAITGTVRLSPDVGDRVPRGAYLYLIASERADGGAPYAFRKTKVPSFPHTFSLGQAHVARMLGDGIVFAEIPEMYLIARIDGDGMAGARPGDLSGACVQNPIAAGARNLEITIDHIN